MPANPTTIPAHPIARGRGSPGSSGESSAVHSGLVVSSSAVKPESRRVSDQNTSPLLTAISSTPIPAGGSQRATGPRRLTPCHRATANASAAASV